MSDWTVIKKKKIPAEEFVEAFTLGGMPASFIFVIEDEYGERKVVYADNSYELGDAIADGDFSEVS